MCSSHKRRRPQAVKDASKAVPNPAPRQYVLRRYRSLQSNVSCTGWDRRPHSRALPQSIEVALSDTLFTAGAQRPSQRPGISHRYPGAEQAACSRTMAKSRPSRPLSDAVIPRCESQTPKKHPHSAATMQARRRRDALMRRWSYPRQLTSIHRSAIGLLPERHVDGKTHALLPRKSTRKTGDAAR